MTLTRLCLLSALPLLISDAAQAGQFTEVAQQLDFGQQPALGMPRPAITRIQVSYQLQWPIAKAGSFDEQKAAISASHTALYEMAGHECKLLRVIYSGECRLVNIAVNNSSNFFNQPAGTIQVGASATFELLGLVETKDVPPKQ